MRKRLYFGFWIFPIFEGGKKFHAILGTILSVLISISHEIFIRSVRSWNFSKFYKETI